MCGAIWCRLFGDARESSAAARHRLRVEYVHYCPARWDTEYISAWRRWLDTGRDSGETTVLEIDVISRDFGLDLPYVLELVDDSWKPCMESVGRLREASVNVSNVSVLPDMRTVGIRLRTPILSVHIGRSAGWSV